MNNNLMTTREVAVYIGVAVSTLLAYRAAGTGPRYIKIGLRLVRYYKSDVDAWLSAQKI